MIDGYKKLNDLKRKLDDGYTITLATGKMTHRDTKEIIEGYFAHCMKEGQTEIMKL